MEKKTYRLEVKAIDEKGAFEGYASVFGNEDLDGDIVCKGAFKQSISGDGAVIPILWQHDQKSPIGWNVEAEEDERGLRVKGQLLEDDPLAKKAADWMRLGLKLGAKPGLSIGYMVLQKAADKGVRLLKKLKLLEYSIVTFPANTEAAATAVKSAVTYQDLPIADESYGWNAGAARGRVKEWSAGDADKYAKAFLWTDADASDPGHVLIADVVNGELKAIPRGIFAAVARIDESDITAAQKTRCRAHLDRYYKKLGKQSPFGDEVEQKASDFRTNLDHANEVEDLYNERYKADRALRETLGNVRDSATDADAKKTAMRKARHDHADVHADLDAREIDALAKVNAANAADTTDEKSGRKLSGDSLKKIKAAAACYSKAAEMHGDAQLMHEQGHRLLNDLMTGTTPADSATGTMSAPGTGDETKEALTGIVAGWKDRFGSLTSAL